jgi:hypothetical protein
VALPWTIGLVVEHERVAVEEARRVERPRICRHGSGSPSSTRSTTIRSAGRRWRQSGESGPVADREVDRERDVPYPEGIELAEQCS